MEGENSRLRHYLARLHRKTFCYSHVSRNIATFVIVVSLLSQTSLYPHVWASLTRGYGDLIIHILIQ